MINSDYLKNLNNAQKEAVLYLEGPLLIVAGAGSGKTKVLTSRIAHIIKEKKAFPNQILSVTFTNKAAKEMQTRVSKMLGSAATGLSWLGTFHSICAKILRKHATAANLNSNFTIIDTDDQTRLIKNICKSENIDIKQLAPRFILAIIDRWKNKGYYPFEVIINKKDIYEKTILPLYKIYQQKLIDLNSCDFGDLILHTVKILENYPDIRQIYTTNFKYILVDEYQDTNVAQYLWLRLLAQGGAQMLGLSGQIDANSIMQLTQGKVFNPYTEQMFSNVQFRTHSFNFKMFARNEDESVEIAHIIKYLKQGALPSYGEDAEGKQSKRFFEVPDKC